MIIAYLPGLTLVPHEINQDNLSLLEQALWIDLIQPVAEEEKTVEEFVHFNIPTREEMQEIELSSRLYKENDVLFMTATMVAQSSSPTPLHDAVTFILMTNKLITIRYIQPQAFKLFTSRLAKLTSFAPINLLIELLDATVDRVADILEMINHHLEDYSKSIFYFPTKTFSHDILLQKVGLNGELNSQVGESLMTFNRLITFLSQSANLTLDNTMQARLLTLSKDINALKDHTNFVSTKIAFLLDATLGMIQIEQNKIIKIFSVAAVIFLPPTLIASIYGMNFHYIPELSWKFGYLSAIGLMLLSSWLPYKYFKHRKWL